MLYQAIAAQQRWAELPEITNQPRVGTSGQRYEGAFAMIESWARRKPRTWIEVSAEAGRYSDSDPSRRAVQRWAERSGIELKPLRAVA